MPSFIKNFLKDNFLILKIRSRFSPSVGISQRYLFHQYQQMTEKGNVPVNRPQFLASGVVGDVILNQKADVWITFVSEGAGFTNAIGYFTYNPASPP